MNKKYLLVSFDDEKVGNLSEVLTNKTCKKVINFLAEKKRSKSKRNLRFIEYSYEYLKLWNKKTS